MNIGVMSNAKMKIITALAFFAIYFIWGTSYLAAAFGLKGFPPFMLSAIRFSIAGAILLCYCLIRKIDLPKGQSLKRSAIGGVLMLVGGSGLVTWAEQYVLSGYAAVVTAMEPFFFVLLDKKLWSFYFSKKNIIIGLITGFAGVVMFIVFSPVQTVIVASPHLVLYGYIALFISCMLWVAGALYSNNESGVNDEKFSTLSIVSVQLLSGGIFSFLLSLAAGELYSFSFPAVGMVAWAGLAYLIIFASIVAFLSFNWLLTVRPPAQVSTHTYVNPIIAVFIGWLVLREPVSLVQLWAVLLILIGVYLTNKSRN